MSINESLPLDHAQHLCMHTRTWIPMPRIERERPTRLNNVLSIWQEDELHRRLILELTFLSVRINFDRRCRFFPFASTKSSTAQLLQTNKSPKITFLGKQDLPSSGRRKCKEITSHVCKNIHISSGQAQTLRLAKASTKKACNQYFHLQSKVIVVQISPEIYQHVEIASESTDYTWM